MIVREKKQKLFSLARELSCAGVGLGISGDIKNPSAVAMYVVYHSCFLPLIYTNVLSHFVNSN